MRCDLSAAGVSAVALSVCMMRHVLVAIHDRTYCVSYTFLILSKACVSQCKCLLPWHPSMQIRPQCLHSFSHCCLVYLLASVSSVEWQPEPVRGRGPRCGKATSVHSMTPLMSIFFWKRIIGCSTCKHAESFSC